MDGLFVAFAALFAAAVLAARAFAWSGRPVAAALVLPLTWTVVEFVFSLVSPDGAFSSLAYTQADVGPIVQLASVTGVLGDHVRAAGRAERGRLRGRGAAPASG